MYVDFTARMGGSHETLKLQGIINAIYCTVNNKWFLLNILGQSNVYIEWKMIAKGLQGDHTYINASYFHVVDRLKVT